MSFTAIGLVQLTIVWQLALSLIAVIVLLIEWRLIRHDAQLCLHYDGQQWRCQLNAAHDELLNIVPPSLLLHSDVLLILAVRLPGEWRLRRVYLASDNCTDAVYRAICRTLR